MIHIRPPREPTSSVTRLMSNDHRPPISRLPCVGECTRASTRGRGMRVAGGGGEGEGLTFCWNSWNFFIRSFVGKDTP